MNDYSELKRLAEAAKNDCGDYVALNDYGMAVPPAVVIGLIDDLLCPACKGSGEGWVLSDGGPDAHHIQVDCPECFGPGTMLGAYQAMKIQRDSQIERTTQAGGELFFMRIELERIKADNEQLSKDADRYRWLIQHEFDVGSFHDVHVHNHRAWFEHIDSDSIDRGIAEDAEFAKESGQ